MFVPYPLTLNTAEVSKDIVFSVLLVLSCQVKWMPGRSLRLARVIALVDSCFRVDQKSSVTFQDT